MEGEIEMGQIVLSTFLRKTNIEYPNHIGSRVKKLEGKGVKLLCVLIFFSNFVDLYEDYEGVLVMIQRIYFSSRRKI